MIRRLIPGRRNSQRFNRFAILKVFFGWLILREFFFQIEEMANIQDLEKEIICLQESIESALQKLQKPRGVFAKFAKISEFEEGN